MNAYRDDLVVDAGLVRASSCSWPSFIDAGTAVPLGDSPAGWSYSCRALEHLDTQWSVHWGGAGQLPQFASCPR